MLKTKHLLFFVLLIISCNKESSEEPVGESQIEPIGEKEFFTNDGTYDLNLDISDGNTYLITGTARLSSDEIWGNFFMKVSDTLSEIYLNTPHELNFDGTQPGCQQFFTTVENHNILVTGNLTPFQCFASKFNSNGELLWFKELENGNATLKIISLVHIEGNYYFLAYQEDGQGGVANKVPIVGKMSGEGSIVFKKQLDTFSLGRQIKILNQSTFILTAEKFYVNEDQTFYHVYNNVHPYVLAINLEGDVLWEAKVDELSTTLFHPSLYYLRKGEGGIYCVYNRRTNASEAKLTKIDLDGNVLFTKSLDNIDNFFPDQDFASIKDVSLDQNDNLYLVGFHNTNDFNVPTGFALAKFDASGNYLNSCTNYGSNNRLSGFGVKVDNDGNIITASENNEKRNITLLKFDENLKIK